MKCSDEWGIFWESLHICCARIYSRLDRRELGKLLFVLALLLFCISPTLLDAALTLQYLGYDAVIVLIEIQFAAIAAFFGAWLMVPLRSAFQNLPFRKNGKYE